MKKLLLTGLLTMTMALSFLTGCSSENQTAKESTAQTSKEYMKTIGITQIAPHGSLDNCREGFIAGLKEAGYEEGKNVTFDIKNAQNDTSNAAMISDTFVSKNYDLICGIATPTAMAAFNSAKDTNIPIIFTAVSDPVSANLVTSLEAPGGICTGTSDSLPLEQQMQMIRAMMPNAKTIGILYTTSEVNSKTHLEKFKKLAPKYNFEIEAIGVTASSDIPIAMDTLVTKCDVINNFTDNNVVNNLDTVLAKANEAKIPVFGSEEEQVKKGCVAAQNIDYFALGKKTGEMAAKVLDGQKAGNLPVEIISDCTPVANKEAMEKFKLTMPKEYKDTVTYLSKE